MLRVILGTFAILSLCSAVMLTADAQTKDAKDAKDTKDEKCKCTITKVDAKEGTITVKMKDKEGKDTTKTFKLTEDIRYFDSTGKAVSIDVFESGNQVLVIEREGKLKEMRKNKEKSEKKTETK